MKTIDVKEEILDDANDFGVSADLTDDGITMVFTLSRLKQMIKEAEAKGDNQLVMTFKKFKD